MADHSQNNTTYGRESPLSQDVQALYEARMMFSHMFNHVGKTSKVLVMLGTAVILHLELCSCFRRKQWIYEATKVTATTCRPLMEASCSLGAKPLSTYLCKPREEMMTGAGHL